MRAHLPPPPSRVLEVGAGNGLLAVALAELGHRVTALDLSLDALAKEARECAGLDLVESDFLDYRGGPWDALLFTRSLHHFPELHRAIVLAKQELRTLGILAIEEFDVLAPDEPTARWYYGPDGFLRAWREEHDETPPLNSGDAIRAAIASQFSIIHEERVPYLYRAMSKRRGEDPAVLLARETEEIRAGAIRPVGVRFVARRLT